MKKFNNLEDFKKEYSRRKENKRKYQDINILNNNINIKDFKEIKNFEDDEKNKYILLNNNNLYLLKINNKYDIILRDNKEKSFFLNEYYKEYFKNILEYYEKSNFIFIENLKFQFLDIEKDFIKKEIKKEIKKKIKK